jgi:hypothetical protein
VAAVDDVKLELEADDDEKLLVQRMWLVESLA